MTNCGYCGAPLKQKYAKPAGTKGRAQHPRWWVCTKGHNVYVKRG
jgi:uncharacterized protein with PIN domain